MKKNDSFMERARRAHMSTKAPRDLVWEPPPRRFIGVAGWTVAVAGAAVVALVAYVLTPSAPVYYLEPVDEPSRVVLEQPVSPDMVAQDKVTDTVRKSRVAKNVMIASGDADDGLERLEPGVEVTRTGAELRREGPLRYTLQKGSTTFYVSSQGRGLRVRVAGGVVHVTGTVFTVGVKGRQGSLSVQEGRVKLVTPSEAVYFVSAGQTRTWSQYPDAREINIQLESYKKAGHHRQAVAYIRRMTSKLPRGTLRASLYVEMALIQGVFLQDWDGACTTLDLFDREGVTGEPALGARELRERFRCSR